MTLSCGEGKHGYRRTKKSIHASLRRGNAPSRTTLRPPKKTMKKSRVVENFPSNIGKYPIIV